MATPSRAPARLRERILAFAETHSITARDLDAAPSLRRVLEAVGDAPCPPASPATLYEALAQIATTLEAALDPEHVTLQGAVYTPGFVTRRLVADALAYCGRVAAPRICDPACGAGAFLLAAVEALETHRGIAPERAIAELVRGIDLSETAVEHARALLELLLLARGGNPGLAATAVLRADSLLETTGALEARLYQGASPHLVCTNPPYVKLQNLPAARRDALARAFGPQLRGSYGLSGAFLLRSLELLAPGGTAAVITQNNLFTSLSGGPIRKLLGEGRSLRRIVDFGHHRVFAAASAYTCLLWVGRDLAAEDFEYAAVDKADAKALEAARFTRIRFDELDARKWRLADRPGLDDLGRLEALPVALPDLVRIRVGFATLKDQVFFVEAAGEACLATGPDGSRIEVEHEATRPALKIPDLRSEEDLARNRRRVIYPYERGPKGPVPLPWAELRARFPRTADHLEAWREVLLTRDKGRLDPAAWYLWGRRQSLEAPGPKLLTATFNRSPRFLLDPTGSLFCNGYALTPHSTALPLRLLQRVLESPVMHYWACLTSFNIQGGYQCYQKNFIERFRLPSFSPAEIERLSALGEASFHEALLLAYGLDPERVTAFLAAYRRG